MAESGGIMKHVLVGMILTTMLLCSVSSPAQQNAATNASAAVPTLVKFSGTLTDVNGKPLSGVVGVTFLLYKDEQGGAPLWMETQNVTLGKNGQYSVMLGSTRSTGLPTDLFSSGEARWLAVQPQGQAEQTRVLLLSVPYALKAGDAATVGGLPPSAFVLAAPSGSNSAFAATSGGTATSASAPPPTTSNVTTTGGTANTIPMYTTATNVQNSILTQIGTTSVNVGGRLVLPASGTATASAGKNSQPEDFIASSYSSGTAAAVNQRFRWQAEPTGNNTASPAGTVNLLYGSGTNFPAETGLKINSKGLITFASGQTFPGTGTITKVTAGTDLTGGGSSGAITLNLDTSKVPTLAAASNTFTGTMSVGSSFSATGSGYFGTYVAAAGDVVTDWYDANSGSNFPGLQLGLNGVSITSKQTSGGNQYGMEFWTNYGDRMSITQNGYVGVGTTGPYTLLHLRQDNSGGQGPSITLMNGGGGAGSAASIDFDGYDTGGNQPTARIVSIDDGNSSSSLAFYTKTPGDAAYPTTEKVRVSDWGSLVLDSQGENALAIGAGSEAGTGLVFGGTGSGEGIASCRFNSSVCTDSANYQHQYGLDFYTNWTRRLSIWNNGDMLAYGCTYWYNGDHQGSCLSDARLKTNIQPFPSVLDKLAQLEPVHFDWKASNPPELHLGSGRQYGFVAQQVEKIFPEMVTVGADGYRRVNYGQLPYLLLQGVRELKASNDGLRAEAKSLRQQNEQAQAEIAKLRRGAAATNARVSRLDRASTAKDVQIARMSREIEQLRNTQQQMAVLLARFAPRQREGANSKPVAAHSTAKPSAARVGE
jgi:endosialidase-like protein